MIIHPFIAYTKTLPVQVVEVDSIHDLPVGWSPVGESPTDDALVILGRYLEVGVAWTRYPFDRSDEMTGIWMEALAHELGHIFGARAHGEVLASEHAALAWEIAVIRRLDMTCPISRAMARKVALVTDGEFSFGSDVDHWVSEMAR